jgi:hypothetical protein
MRNNSLDLGPKCIHPYPDIPGRTRQVKYLLDEDTPPSFIPMLGGDIDTPIERPHIVESFKFSAWYDKVVENER